MISFIEGLFGYTCDNVAYDVLSPAPIKGFIAIAGTIVVTMGVKDFLKDKLIDHYIDEYQKGNISKEEGEEKATKAVKILNAIMH